MRWLMTALAASLLAACANQETTLDKTPSDIRPAAPSFESSQHLWLEEVEGDKALDWVRSQNDRTLGVLQGDPRYQTFYDAALKIATSQERIPYGSVRKGYVYNFWQDATHERGLWRRTTVAGYAAPSPQWETLLDIDALSKAESANWVYKGVDCLPPEYTRCLVSLSDGGKDAATEREFDLSTKSFIKDGFVIPEAKSSVIWKDQDTLLIATDWGDGASLTESGYPFVVKELKRGQALAQAKEIYRGTQTDVATSPFTLEEESGERWFGLVRSETFFTSSYFLLPPQGGAPLQVPLPAKATLQGVYRDEVLVSLEQDWEAMIEGGAEGPDEPTKASFKSGDLIGFPLRDFLSTGKLTRIELVLRPTATQAIEDVSITRGAVLITLMDSVVPKVFKYTKADDVWTSAEIPLPANGTASVIFADPEESLSYLGFESFIEPDSLYAHDSGSGALTAVKALPAWFDATGMAVDQFHATSKDGTKVPYFVVRARATKLDGNNPTLLYGYGGFQVSYTPSYSGTTGKLWLESGGVYVLANIRGGGEFGPAWHQAGLKTHRQVVYDDFIAVAEDLVARKLTRPEKLGAMGGSNGGLLMGVMYTQRPDLFKAIVCQVPLLDMLRYHLLLAGASWMDEYGDPDVPGERAFLETLSPYHNVDPGRTYPEIYFETSTKDDRVHPGHARKMAKRLEDLGKPFLYYENIDGGHSAAANQREAARRAALEYTYLSRKLMDGL